ncbi:hypothetical protein [Clostridium sporogenes]|uniref:hypothetical protein n=1 Tax=Clostridium sporogenes TaxID=1509 RepID=UPI002237B113|nr:hypothetical protein [Clostridium sporogenes]MCW6112185.1 hypothetical protein [Clostridium sporogenes]
MDINEIDIYNKKIIKELAKEMTREEFLDEFVSETTSCPSYYGLKKFHNTICNAPINCKECYDFAIKDIKFKGEDNMEFDWEGFKNNKFVVLCDTEEKAKDFLKECDKRGLSWSDGKSAENYIYYKDYDTCYTYNFNNCEHLQYSSKSFYLDNGYKIIEWEIENKIDYDREYNIMEIMEFEEDMEFIDNMRLKVRFKNGCMEVWSNTKLQWVECKITKNWLNSKFKLIKKDKKVSFKEAIQAYGKEIYCIWKTSYNTETKSCYKFGSKESMIIDKEGTAISPNEILNGEWYIKED